MQRKTHAVRLWSPPLAIAFLVAVGCDGGEQESAANNVAPSNIAGSTAADGSATPGGTTADLDETIAAISNTTAGLSWDAPEGWESQCRRRDAACAIPRAGARWDGRS